MTRLQHAKAILVLGLPLVGSHVAQVAIGVTDALMLGRYSVTALAGSTIAHSIWFVLFLFGAGIAAAVMPMVAEATSTGDIRSARRTTRMGMWASLAFALATLPLLLIGAPIFTTIGQEPDVAEAAGAYIRIAAFGMIPALAVQVLRSHVSALELTRIVFFTTVAAALLNVLLNWLLIYGSLGFPEMGIRGAALASVIGHLAGLVMLMAYIARRLPEHDLLTRFWRVDMPALVAVMRLGIPIGLTQLAEVGLFAGSAVMMGWIGEIPLAAHGIALQLASLAFVVHLGLSQAATVRAGAALGRGDRPGLRRGASTAIAVSALIALSVSLLFVLAPEFLIGAFLSEDEPERAAILATGATLLIFAGIFQFADAAQVMALGVLRGLHDTAVPMWIAGVSYWLVGIPVAYLLAFPLGMGAVGIWLGLASGLAVAALSLMLRLWGPMVRRIERGEIAAA